MQKTTNGQKVDGQILNLNFGNPSYIVLFEDDAHPPSADNSQIVTVRSVEEAGRFSQLLGDACRVYLSPEYRLSHPDIAEQTDQLTDSLRNSGAMLDTDAAAALLRKLPLDLETLVHGAIAVNDGDLPPARIDRVIVHKHSDANVLISAPLSRGGLRYYNMFLETGELNFDHTSPHVQGMHMLEALRQVGIATGHLQGLPSGGQIALLNYNTNFYSFIERNSPIVIRAYSSFTADETSEDKEILVFTQVLQWGRVCAEAMLKGFAFMSRQRCEQKEAQLARIAARHKTMFESKIRKVLETENNG
jgi:2-oxo-3-(phosphooxy)propyl 3-oxoalkanoate synthase